MRSKIVLFVLVVFFILFAYSSYNSYLDNSQFQTVNHGSSWGMPRIFEYGVLVAIVLGLSSMYSEFGTRAINTLIVKPIYRDTILNGKLFGALCFAFCIFLFTALIDTALNFILYGTLFASNFPLFLNALPIVLALFLLCFMTFYLLTALMFIAFKSSSLSLFLAFLSWIFIYRIMPNITFASYISLIFPNNEKYIGSLIGGLSPSVITFNVMMGATSLSDAINANAFEFIKLLMYVIVLLALCYTAFLRRDIQ